MVSLDVSSTVKVASPTLLQTSGFLNVFSLYTGHAMMTAEEVRALAAKEREKGHEVVAEWLDKLAEALEILGKATGRTPFTNQKDWHRNKALRIKEIKTILSANGFESVIDFVIGQIDTHEDAPNHTAGVYAQLTVIEQITKNKGVDICSDPIESILELLDKVSQNYQKEENDKEELIEELRKGLRHLIEKCPQDGNFINQLLKRVDDLDDIYSEYGEIIKRVLAIVKRVAEQYAKEIARIDQVAEQALKTAKKAEEKATEADDRSKTAFFTAHDGTGNRAETYFQRFIRLMHR